VLGMEVWGIGCAETGFGTFVLGGSFLRDGAAGLVVHGFLAVEGLNCANVGSCV
jgi:hypothetical protein